MTAQHGPPDLGTAEEELARLLEALGLPHDHGADHAEKGADADDGPGTYRSDGAEGAASVADLAAQLLGRLRVVTDPLATGAAECRVCPVCRVIGAVRGVSPEVRGHLATAGTALLQAVAAMLATDVPPGPWRTEGVPKPGAGGETTGSRTPPE